MPRVQESRVVEAPRPRVWEIVRPFDAIAQWNPFLASCRMVTEQPPDCLGSVRVDVSPDGEEFRERLVEMSDLRTYYVYEMIDSPLPVEDYYGRIELDEISRDEHTLATWSARFDVRPGGSPGDIVELVRDVFRQGVGGIAESVR